MIIVLIAESYPLTTAASIEILTPVVDISDDDTDDDDFSQIDNNCRYTVTRRTGLISMKIVCLHVFFYIYKKTSIYAVFHTSKKSMFKKNTCSYSACFLGSLNIFLADVL